MIAALPSHARAQDPDSPRTPPQAPTTVSTSADSNATYGSGWWSSTQSHWTAAGFVGGNFGGTNFGGTTNMDSSVDFGGQIGYLFHGVIGGEFLADFTPKFQMNNALFANNPNLNTYMANLMVAVPFGAEHRVQPYASGGWGGMQLRSDVLTIAGAPAGGQTTANETIGAGNFGFGVLGYAGNVGVRGDVRYFRAFNNTDFGTTNTPADVFAQSALSGLRFWRANIGVAVRW
jgi:hypothetical protein